MAEISVENTTEESNAFLLSGVEQGRKVRFIGVRTGRDLQARLTSMGLAPGVELEVLRNSHHGPFIIAVDHNRLVLGRGMAHNILVA